ncbi:MAG: 50S ribosomal protein L11 methyltransferase [Deltaproteobacteria bacterium]|nr:50S ribosomal protein L11 methyltransferase [Deltaproteobacteria bacterium]
MNQNNLSTNIPLASLYIYYLKGNVDQNEKFFSNTFLGNWEEGDFSFLFFSSPSSDEVEKLLQIQPELTLLDHYQMSYEEWLGDSLEPFQVGHFFIHPPWKISDKNSEVRNELIDIILDPGVVFGSGKHTTTRDCLEAIELAFSNGKIESAIDLGTGTGLLAIAAAKMGCKSVLAVDLNYLAAKTAEKNIRLNRTGDKILSVRGSAEYFLDNDTDLVIANIHYDVMKSLLSSKGFLGRKFFILSGLLRSQVRDITSKLSSYQVTILKKWEYDGIWHTFLGKVC